MAEPTVEQIWNEVRGEGNPEYAAASPDFRARLQHAFAEARAGRPETGIAGLEEFEREARASVKAEAQVGDPTAPTLRDSVAAQAAEPTPKGSGAQDPEEKAERDAAAKNASVEHDEAHSPSAPSAARPLAAEAPGSVANPVSETAGDAVGEAGGGEADDSSAKKGKLPEGFPGLAALSEAGVTSYGKLRTLKGDYTSIPGVGDATAAKIKEELGEEE